MAIADRPVEHGAAETGHALYLYCVARRRAVTAIDGVGVDDEHPLDLIPFKDVVAIVSLVKMEDFCGPAAEARLSELAWVAPRVCRHEAVVERAMHASPVVPVPFATLFSSEERLRTWLDAHEDAISRALDRLADHDEWAVKGLLDRSRAEARLLAAAVEERRDGLSASPGARYFEDRRMHAAVGREMNTWLRDVCAEIVRDLCAQATDFRERSVVATGPDEERAPILNWAFLVPRGAADDFAARLQTINTGRAEEGLAFRLSGPWPPYSFCPLLEPDPPA